MNKNSSSKQARKALITGILTLAVFIPAILTGQTKIPLNSSVYDDWKAVEKSQLSNDGNVAVYEINPQLGDGNLYIHWLKTGKKTVIPRGYDAAISPLGNYVAFKIKPPYAVVRKAKLDGKKKDDMPADSLGYVNDKGWIMKYPDLNSFSVPENGGNWFSALMKAPKPEVKKQPEDSLAKEVKPKKPAAKLPDATDVYDLYVFMPSDTVKKVFNKVNEAVWSGDGSSLLYSTFSNDSMRNITLTKLDAGSQHTQELINRTGFIKNLASDATGNQNGWLFSQDTSKVKRYALFYKKASDPIKLIADTVSDRLPAGKSPSENRKPYFSEDGSKLYFGLADTPRIEPKDTLTDDEKARVDVWHWQDPELQPMQVQNLNRDKRYTHLAVYHTGSGEIVVLTDDRIRNTQAGFKNNGRYLIGYDNRDYSVETSWTSARYQNIYLIDNVTGGKKLLLDRFPGRVYPNPTVTHIAYFNVADSLWYTMDVQSGLTKKHSAEGVDFYDKYFDVPGFPNAAGSAGWTSESEFVVYDNNDLWKLYVNGNELPANITQTYGRNNNIEFISIYNDREYPYVGTKNGLYLSGLDKTTKQRELWFLPFGGKVTKLAGGPYAYTNFIRARNADQFLWARGNFNDYPDLYLSGNNFNKAVRLSDANPQMKNYKWGTVELVEWYALDGRKMQGLLYKPEKFDPKKKYPLVAYFYEKHSDNLYQHIAPRPSRSIINPTYMVSNDYLVFVPDINYTVGNPGRDAVNAVVSGIASLLEKGFVDKDRLGIQGQSWGGYQTAYIITQTPMFAAAFAGAPVSNMTSAYGGIRWGSGMVRQFQYEEGQSRIGGNLWERPLLYLENSPLFYLEKVQTPLLIMANDNDGAVPWYQGIELFSGLRRLQKPVWMLNYNGDDHNLTRRANMQDLDRRMMEFFDHYLRGAPAPEWMTTGVPALDKGKK